MIVTAEQKLEAEERNKAQEHIFELEQYALHEPDPFLAKRYRDEIQRVMKRWHGGAA